MQREEIVRLTIDEAYPSQAATDTGGPKMRGYGITPYIIKRVDGGPKGDHMGLEEKRYKDEPKEFGSSKQVTKRKKEEDFRGNANWAKKNAKSEILKMKLQVWQSTWLIFLDLELGSQSRRSRSEGKGSPLLGGG